MEYSVQAQATYNLAVADDVLKNWETFVVEYTVQAQTTTNKTGS